jgi:hypothetical protein
MILVQTSQFSISAIKFFLSGLDSMRLMSWLALPKASDLRPCECFHLRSRLNLARCMEASSIKIPLLDHQKEFECGR